MSNPSRKETPAQSATTRTISLPTREPSTRFTTSICLPFAVTMRLPLVLVLLCCRLALPPLVSLVAVPPRCPLRCFRLALHISFSLCLVLFPRLSTSSRDARRDRLGDLVRLRGRFFIRPIIGR